MVHNPETTGGDRWRLIVALVGCGLVIVVFGAGLAGGVLADATGAHGGDETTIQQYGNFEVTIEATNSPIQDGETLTVTAEVENTVDEGDTQEIVLVIGDTIRDSTDLTLEGGDSETVTLEWVTESGDAGEYEAIVSSDDDSDSTTVSVESAAEEAFFAVTIDDTSDPVTEGKPLEVEATVTNTGDVGDTQEITLFAAGSDVASESVTLGGQQSQSITFTWQTESGDAGEYEAVVSSADGSDTVAVTVEEQPDPAHVSVAILEVTSPVEPGDPIAVEAELTNTGEETATQEIELSVNGTPVDDPVEVALTGGESETLAWETTLDEPGSFEFVVSSGDDTDSAIVTVEEPPVGPQLEVSILETTADPERDRQTTRVRVTNTGDEPGTDEIELLIDGESFPDPVVGEPDEPLEPGESTELELTWSTSDLESGTYQLTTRMGDDSDSDAVTIEPIDEDIEVTEDDSFPTVAVALAIGGAVLVTGALLYRRRQDSTSTVDEPGDDALSTESVTKPEVLAATTEDRVEPPPDEAEPASHRSVPVSPTPDDDCEDEAEAFAEMLNDLESAMADAATAEAEAEAAAERAQAAAEEYESAENRYDERSDDLDSAEEKRDDIQEQLDEAREEWRDAHQEKEEKEREHRRVRDQVTRLQEQKRRLSDDGASQFSLGAMRRQIAELEEERRELLHDYKDSIDEVDRIRPEINELERQLEWAESDLDRARERYEQADTEAEKALQEKENAEAEAEAAAEAAEDAAETVEGLREDVMAAAEEYGDCIEGYLEELEELSEEARDLSERSANRADNENESAKDRAEDGDEAAEEAFPEGDPVGAADEEYEKGKRNADAAEGEADWSEDKAEEAGGASEKAEEMRELLEELQERLRERGLPGADDLPTGDETAERTRENAEAAERAAEAARRAADEASREFSRCTDGETRPVRGEIVVERNWEPHPDEPVEIDFDAWTYPGASDHDPRGQRARMAIEGMSVVFTLLTGDVEEIVKKAMEHIPGDVDEETEEQLAEIVSFLVDESEVMPEIGGKAGIPAKYYSALFSAGVELLGGAEELRDGLQEIDKGYLVMVIPILRTERAYRVELYCNNGRWNRRKGDFIGENETSELWERTATVSEPDIPEWVSNVVESIREEGAEGATEVRSTD